MSEKEMTKKELEKEVKNLTDNNLALIEQLNQGKRL